MQNRRDFLKGSLALAAGAFGIWPVLPAFAMASARPSPGERKFSSPAVEKRITAVKSLIGDPELARMFENCLPNTLDTTIHMSTFDNRPDTFVVTGDIEAMWLRDSTAQVWPYLPMAREDQELKAMLAGVINRQVRCVLLDPYANAFTFDPARRSEWQSDLTEMKPGIHERKWEVDSLAYVMRLSHGYWKATQDNSPFDSRWREAMALIARTYREQQKFNGPGPYRFQRRTDNPIDTLWRGTGFPTRPCGLVNTAFRPSDDAAAYNYLIPANALAAVALKSIAELFKEGLHDAQGAGKYFTLAGEIEGALRKYAPVPHTTAGTIYTYEIDGFGNALFTDDPNIPNLISLPYMGWCRSDDATYLRTRSFIFSPENPWFFKGATAEGVGGPHTGLRQIWPLGIIMRALTSANNGEINRCLAMLKATHAGTELMHESFDADNPKKYSRPWFGWANSLFGELILNLAEHRPHVLKASP